MNIAKEKKYSFVGLSRTRRRMQLSTAPTAVNLTLSSNEFVTLNLTLSLIFRKTFCERHNFEERDTNFLGANFWKILKKREFPLPPGIFAPLKGSCCVTIASVCYMHIFSCL